MLSVKRSFLNGVFVPPSDKSISHRVLILAALAEGKSRVFHLQLGKDCLATQRIMSQLGVYMRQEGDALIIEGRGLHGLQAPSEALDCQGSGTSMRLLAGLLIGQPFSSQLVGNSQLTLRPMGRIVKPLQLMGANIKGEYAPLTIAPVLSLQAINYELLVPSAQVKSGLLLAGMYTQGVTSITEPLPTRDHTERLLTVMGVSIERKGKILFLSPPAHALKPFHYCVPGDFSSAAFFLAAALICPGSHLLLQGVGVNWTRSGLLEVCEQMGALIRLENERLEFNEPVADISVSYQELKSVHIGKEMVPRLIDELPILALLATQAEGTTLIEGAKELAFKETHRIKTVAAELQKMGAVIEAKEDGWLIQGPCKLKGAAVESQGDHRLAMMLTVAGLCAEGLTVIKDPQAAGDSFPGFYEALRSLGANMNPAEPLRAVFT